MPLPNTDGLVANVTLQFIMGSVIGGAVDRVFTKIDDHIGGDEVVFNGITINTHSDNKKRLFKALLQAYVTSYLAVVGSAAFGLLPEDPTGGLIYSLTLFESQSKFRKNLKRGVNCLLGDFAK